MNRLRSWLLLKTKKLPAYLPDFNAVTRSLPEADKWALSRFILEKVVPVVGIHPYPLDELLLMSSTLAYFKPDFILEWGTNVGKSARIFYETVEYLDLRTKIHSVDLPPDTEHGENIHDSGQRGMFVLGRPVILHLGDGLTVARQVLLVQQPVLPLFFVDGDHNFTSVRNELDGIKEIAPHAVILVHDTFLQGAESGYNCGPFEAIKGFTAQHQLSLQSTLLGLPGMSLTYW